MSTWNGSSCLALRNLLDGRQIEAVDRARQRPHHRLDRVPAHDVRRAGASHSRTGVSGGRPASTAMTLSTARLAIAVRVSVVALARCGTSITFSSGEQAGVDGGLVLVDIERGAGNQPLLERP